MDLKHLNKSPTALTSAAMCAVAVKIWGTSKFLTPLSPGQRIRVISVTQMWPSGLVHKRATPSSSSGWQSKVVPATSYSLSATDTVTVLHYTPTVTQGAHTGMAPVQLLVHRKEAIPSGLTLFTPTFTTTALEWTRSRKSFLEALTLRHVSLESLLPRAGAAR
jgi:hypothetical protein